MVIGVDFDNTIICYDKVFNRVALEKGLIPENLAEGKGFVRDYLRAKGAEDEWTRLQGIVYGTQLDKASAYPGVTNFFKFCKDNGVKCFIVSHKTRHPYLGEPYDLHGAAKKWIRSMNFGVKVFFEETKEAKVDRIRALNCSIFIDDLPEFLSLPGFPPQMKKVLFDPLSKHACAQDDDRVRLGAWQELPGMIRGWTGM